jgi:hypothetical protein
MRYIISFAAWIACLGLAALQPDWIRIKPVDPQYEISIVRAGNQADSSKAIARDSAVREIAAAMSATNPVEIVSLAASVGLFQTWPDKHGDWFYYRLDKPQYYRDRLVDGANGYYFGSGETTRDRPDYQARARAMALSELSAQISCEISGEVLSELTEKSGVAEEEISQKIRLNTEAELRDFEVVKTIETNTRYWFFCRLSREEYVRQQQEIRENAMNRSMDLFQRMQREAGEGAFANALGDGVRALQTLDPVLGQELTITIDGRECRLDQEVLGAIRDLLGGINISLVGDQTALHSGQLGKVKLLLQSKGEPVRQATLHFSLVQGLSVISPDAVTDDNGIATLFFRETSAEIPDHIVTTRMTMQDFSELPESALSSALLKGIALPRLDFHVTVTGLSHYLESEEMIKGELTSNAIIAAHIHEYYTSKGDRFVDRPDLADDIIRIRADARENPGAMGLVTASVNATLSVVDRQTGKEIAGYSVDLVKGASTTFEQAAKKAYGKAAGDLIGKLDSRP